MGSIVDMYFKLGHVLYSGGEANKALLAQKKRVALDDVERVPLLNESPLIVAVIGPFLEPSKNSILNLIRLGLTPMLHDGIEHGEDGVSLGRACKILLADDSNGNIEKTITHLFSSDDIFLFLVSLRRILKRTNKSIRLDLNLIEKQLKHKFQFQDSQITTNWFLDLYSTSTKDS